MKSVLVLSIFVLLLCSCTSLRFINAFPQKTNSVLKDWKIHLLSKDDSYIKVYKINDDMIALSDTYSFSGTLESVNLIDLEYSLIIDKDRYEDLLANVSKIVDYYDKDSQLLYGVLFDYSITTSPVLIDRKIYNTLSGTLTSETVIESPGMSLLRIQLVRNTSNSGEPRGSNMITVCSINGSIQKMTEMDIRNLKRDLLNFKLK